MLLLHRGTLVTAFARIQLPQLRLQHLRLDLTYPLFAERIGTITQGTLRSSPLPPRWHFMSSPYSFHASGA